MRTARSITSGENFGDFLMLAPFSIEGASSRSGAVQEGAMRRILDGVLRDTLYALLLGLDGAASIGTCQQSYTLTAQDGSLVYEPGELEAEAWRQLQNDA
jgi:hypothetical protein